MSDKIYIKLTHNQDKQQGDNRPIFVAPVNPKSPEGKTWRLNVKIGETWYNQKQNPTQSCNWFIHIAPEMQIVSHGVNKEYRL